LNQRIATIRTLSQFSFQDLLLCLAKIVEEVSMKIYTPKSAFIAQLVLIKMETIIKKPILRLLMNVNPAQVVMQLLRSLSLTILKRYLLFSQRIAV
jgi:hypothetical protein